MAENVWLWSITASDNDDADPAVPWAENMLPGQVNNSARSTMAGVARFRDDINGAVTTTGSSNTYLATANSGISAFTNRQLLSIKANFTNTGAATLNVSSLGAKSIRVFDSTGERDVSAGQIQSGCTYDLVYDSALNSAAGAWLLRNPTPESGVGTIKIWSTDTAPTNYLFCNGQSVSRTTYAALFAVIGTTYGAADGTHFNVPDLAGRAPFGSSDMGGISDTGRITNAGSGIVGTTLGASGGAETVTLTQVQIPSHTHTATTDAAGAHSHTGSTNVGEGLHSHSVTTSSGGSHNHTVAVTTVQTGTSSAATVLGAGGSVSTSTDGAHTHTVSISSDGAHTHTFTTAGAADHTHNLTTNATGGGGSHSNMPPALIVNFIIKAL